MYPRHTFVLVHGGWQGEWSWEPTAAILTARGHRVFSPVLPGHDPGDTDRSKITHDDYVAAVFRAVAESGPGPVVLVGHGLGGAVISQVADRWPDRVASLVYYAAFVLADGEAIGDLLGPALEEFQQLSPARTDRSMSMPWELWRSHFMQTADDDAARAAYQRLVPEPRGPVYEPVWLPWLTTSYRVPAAYVSCRQDQTQPPGFWHPGMSSRLPGARVIEIDADHQALITAPQLLADAVCAGAGHQVPAEALVAA